MDWKRLVKSLLFPHIAIMLILVPVSIAFLVYSMVVFGTKSAFAIISYVFSFYTLLIWCFKIPNLVQNFKRFKYENKYAKRWWEDAGLRVKTSLYGTLIWNISYAALQLGMGVKHKTFWFCSLAGYYFLLAVMRFFLLRHTSRHTAGERMGAELRKYRTCGIILLFMNLALALIIFFMVYWNRTFKHYEITTIALAAFTFISLTRAIINMVKYRKYNSPVFSASKAISLASACVSLLILESTMLTTFGDGTVDLTMRRIMLGATGGAVSVFIILMAINMILEGTKKIKQLND